MTDASELEHMMKALAGEGGGEGGACVGSLIVDVLLELVDEMSLGVAFEVHRSMKLGLLCSCLGAPSPQHKHRGIVEMQGYDIFGQVAGKMPQDAFPCPKCGQSKLPAKFAPHLDKCMGGGRESRRVAASKAKAMLNGENGVDESVDNETFYGESEAGDGDARRFGGGVKGAKRPKLA